MEEGRAAGSHAQQPTMDSIGWVVGQDPREESSERSKWDIFLSVSVSIELPVRAFIGTTCRTFRRHAKFVHLARS